MRLKDREIVEFDEIIDLIKKCEVCRIAMMDEEYPYIVPMNFGVQMQEENIIFYFHTAREGRKVTLLRKNPNVAFEMDCEHEVYVNDKNTMCSMAYASVMGEGTMQEVEKDEKQEAMNFLLSQYPEHQDVQYNLKTLDYVIIWKLVVKRISAKQNKRS